MARRSRRCFQRRALETHFAETGLPVRCACHTLASALGHRQDIIFKSDAYGESHLWTTWSNILQRSDGPTGRLDPVSQLQARLRILCPQIGVGECYPFPATAVLSEDRQNVAAQTVAAAVRLLRSYSSGREFLRVCGADRVSATVHESVNDWLCKEADVASYGLPADRILTRQWLFSLWSSSRRQLLITNLDKRASDLRFSCPRLGQLEILHDVSRYFGSLADTVNQQLTTHLVQQWVGRILEYVENKCCGVNPPDGAVPMPRALPKGKDPGRKARLLVDYSVSPATDLHSMASRAVDWIVTHVLELVEFQDFTVSSMGGVQRKLQVCEGAIGDPNAGRFLVCRKTDFVSFFLEVSREQCLLAVQMWCQKLQALSDRGRWIRVKDVQWTQQDKEMGFSGVPGEGDKCQLLRRRVTAPGWACFQTSLLPSVLALDFASLLQSDRHIWRQSRGIPMGSPWGTVACRAWACLREYLFRHLMTWARQFSPHGRDTGCTAPWTAMRWVDDRWWALRCDSLVTARATCAADTLTYTNLPLHQAHALAVIATRLALPLDAVCHLCKEVASFLVCSVDQTHEDPASVVGIDIVFAHAATGDLLHEVDEYGLAKGLDQGCVIGAVPVQLLSRITTKNCDLLNDITWVRASRPQPRFSARITDVRAAPERAAALMGWVTRLADCTYSKQDWVLPVRSRHECPDEAVLHPWQGRAVVALIRELVLSGWDVGTCTNACERVLASSLVREPAPQILHRIAVVRKMLKLVRAEEFDCT